MKKTIFNNGQELEVQSVTLQGSALVIKTISTTADILERLLTQKFATESIVVANEFGIHSEQYEGYTEFQGIMHYTGGILGGILCKAGETLEERLSSVEGNVEAVMKDIEDIKESGTGGAPESYAAVFSLSQIQAQSLTDTQALTVKDLYEQWEILVKRKFKAEKAGFKFLHGQGLYKTINDDQEFQAQWIPGEGTESIFTHIDESHAGTKADPIPYAGNMELEQGKYYSQDGVIYLCNRDTGQAVYQSLKDLAGIYVEVAA